MSFWKVAAAQYEPRKTSLTEQVAHHLEFVRAAARQQCQLLVFPSLSLLGCGLFATCPSCPTRSLTVRPALLCRNDLANDHHCRPSR